MFAYCNNNPVNHYDPNGYGAFSVSLAFAGAAVNVFATAVAAMVTGKTYTLADAGVAATAGFINAVSGWGSLAAGAISGVWAAFSAYQNGTTFWGALLSGTASAAATIFSISNLALFSGTSAEVAEIVLVDSAFGTGYNIIASTVDTAVTTPIQRNPKSNRAPVGIASGGGTSVKRLFR